MTFIVCLIQYVSNSNPGLITLISTDRKIIDFSECKVVMKDSKSIRK